MLTVLTVSTLFLTVCILALGLAVFVLARQIGVLHERLAPIGLQPVLAGLQVGQAIPQLTARTVQDTPFRIGGTNPDDRPMLLMFVSADCPVCKRALPLAQSVTQANNIALVLVGEGEVAALVAMANRTPLNGAPLLISNELLLLMQIGRLPTMVALSPDGVITARDVASNRREIETLVATLPQARLPQIKESLHAAV